MFVDVVRIAELVDLLDDDVTGRTAVERDIVVFTVEPDELEERLLDVAVERVTVERLLVDEAVERVAVERESDVVVLVVVVVFFGVVLVVVVRTGVVVVDLRAVVVVVVRTDVVVGLRFVDVDTVLVDEFVLREVDVEVVTDAAGRRITGVVVADCVDFAVVVLPTLLFELVLKLPLGRVVLVGRAST